MLSLGIDLASQDRDTASCLIDWQDGRAEVELPKLGRSNAELLEEAKGADWVGIDAPFGWPDAFVAAVVDYAETGRWPTSELPWAPRVKRLRYRATDLFAEARARLPLSVSTDLIAITAMRAAVLLTELQDGDRPIERTGSDQVVEVYPAAALVTWGFEVRGYKAKGEAGREARRKLTSAIEERGAPWLQLPDEASAVCVRADHALDALVSALICRAAERALTWPPDEAGQLKREGWIHLPRDAGTFDLLPRRNA